MASKLRRPRPTQEPNVLPRNDTGPVYELANATWGPRLRFDMHRYGDGLVDFDSLWPSGEDLKRSVDDFKETELEYCVLDCCRLTVTCGPLRVLRAMLQAKVISIHQMFQPHGVTLLHMACVAQSPETVAALLTFGPAWEEDLLGRTPTDVCQDTLTRQKFPAARRVEEALKRRRPPSRFCGVERSEVFQMAGEPMKFVEVLVKLQSMEPVMDLNTEQNEAGDCLVHIATACGLPQMALLLALHRLYNVNFNLPNRSGMTPLCIATEAQELYLVELLICVLGADPNMANTLTGSTPLHYAAKHCNPTLISTLIKRGALVNIEDKNCCRPDDIVPQDNPNFKECVQLIRNERDDRMLQLSAKAANGTLHWQDLHTSDLFTINQHGNTLLMEAALNDRSAVVNLLCGHSPSEGSPVNAQHFKTGRTALSMCAEAGHSGSLQQLLRHGAHPGITDINGMIPLHHACYHQQQACVEQLLQPLTGLIGLCKAKTFTKNTGILQALREAHERRQAEVIKPMLFECVQKGDFEELGAFVWEEDDDVNCMNDMKDWPLLLAAQNGHSEIVTFLFQRGGLVTQQHEVSGTTPLHLACKGGHSAVVEFLLEFTTSGSSQVAGLIPMRLRNGQPLLDINVRDAYGRTALELAVAQGQTQVIKQLCLPPHGASCTVPDSSEQMLSSSQFMGVQVMLEKFREQHMERVVKLFLDRKDFPKLKMLWVGPYDHHLRDKDGDSPLMVACWRRAHMDVINFLLSDFMPKVAETPPGSTTTSGRMTPRSSTASRPSRYSSPALRPGTPMPQGYTPMRRRKRGDAGLETGGLPAIGERNVSARRRLDLTPAGSESETAVDGAAASAGEPEVQQNGYREVESDDLEVSGADLREQSLSGGSGSDVSMIVPPNFSNEPPNNMLLAQGRNGKTALHYAIAADHKKAVAAIIQADQRTVNIIDKCGNSPIHLAASKKQKDIVRLLLSCPNIQLNQQNNDCKIPEEVAPRKLSNLIRDKRIMLDSCRPAGAPHRHLSEPWSPSSSTKGRVDSLASIPSTLSNDSMDFSHLTDRLEAMKENGTD